MLNNSTVKKAFRILRRNYGCPGLDNLSIHTVKSSPSNHFKSVIKIYETNSLNQLPVKRSNLVDYTGKRREIYVYCLYDRWVQQIIKLQIEPIINSYLKKCVFSYKRNSNISMLRSYILSFYPKFVLCLDVAKFFDNINREYLLNLLRTNTSISGELLYKIELCLKHQTFGLPQGNVLSPILSNYYLSELDDMFELGYARFSDDMFFAMNDPNEKDAIINTVSAKLEKLNLSINFEKTVVTDATNFK